MKNMSSNQETIKTFYTAFQNKDYKTMQACYSNEATFSDAVFTNLNAQEVRAMWEMLVKRGTDLQLTFSNVHSTDDSGSADWVASYTFSASKRKVVNRIHAEFKLKNGLIVEHKDSFSFYRWSRQALGSVGFMLGWTSFLKNKVRKTARKGLDDFMVKSRRN